MHFRLLWSDFREILASNFPDSIDTPAQLFWRSCHYPFKGAGVNSLIWIDLHTSHERVPRLSWSSTLPVNQLAAGLKPARQN